MIRFAALVATLVLSLALVERVPAQTKITVLGLFSNRSLITIDGKQRLLRAGESSPEGVMLISATSREAVIEVDGHRDTYRLGTHIGSSFKSPEQPAVQLWPSVNGMYTVVGSINGYPIDFLLDTGATFISINEPQARRMGIDYRVRGEVAMASTASGTTTIYIVDLARVRIGEIELTNVKAAVHDGAFPAIALLGMSFLNRLDMKRDGKMLELKRKF